MIAAVRRKGEYLWNGVWDDHRPKFSVRLVKTLNLSVRTMLDPRLHTRSYALTFNTLLSIVPAFALMLAVCKGFGLQNLFHSEIEQMFPSQRKMTDVLMQLVNSYLNGTSHGVFIGIGIVFLLYTVVTLMNEIASNFNWIWGVRDDRTLYRKIVDHVAVCLLIPVLFICSAGINLLMNDTLREQFQVPLLSPLIGWLLDLAPFFLVCVAFTLSFYWIPHTTVKLRYAAISGMLSGVAFQILQLVFLNGQIMVSRYNAIYGSFSFLPLFLMWLMISWLIVLSGCVVAYSAQHVFSFPFAKSSDNVSGNYYRKVTAVVAAIVSSRHLRGLKPMSAGEISAAYGMPVRLVARVVAHLKDVGLLYHVAESGRTVADCGVVPSFDLSEFTVADLIRRIDALGVKDFIPLFEERFSPVIARLDAIDDAGYKVASEMTLKELALTIDY